MYHSRVFHISYSNLKSQTLPENCSIRMGKSEIHTCIAMYFNSRTLSYESPKRREKTHLYPVLLEVR